MKEFEEIYTYFKDELPLILARLPLGEEGKRVGIYGLGIHTERLLEKYIASVGKVKAKLCFIDSYKETFSELYKGYPVYNVNDIGGMLDCIIISSSIYENKMYEKLLALYGNQFKIYRFYENGKKDIFIRKGKYLPNNIDEKTLLKINFADFWPGFDKINNFWTDILFSNYRLELSETPDILFCSHFGSEHTEYSECKKIFIVTEPWKVNYNNYDYAFGYEYIKRDSYFRFNVYSPRCSSIQNRDFLTDIELAKRRFCNFIYSNGDKRYEGVRVREQFCLELNNYKQVDCPGKVLNNMKDVLSNRGALTYSEDKIEFIKNYKFTIAFENSKIIGYTTEKLWQPFYAGSIPIYWGNPLIGEAVSREAFVNCNDYDNDLKAVVNKVKEIDSDDELYMYMLSKSPLKSNYHYVTDDEIMDFLNKIIFSEV